MSEIFKGVCPVINTPFNEHGDIDYDSLQNIIEYVLRAGCRSISLYAFNSEPHKMTLAEKQSVTEFFLRAVDSRAKTLVGIIENSLRQAIEQAQRARSHKADALIVYPPTFFPPAEPKILEYFRTIASELDCPLMIQDAPRSTGVTMSVEFLLKAFEEIESIQAVKVECPLPVRKVETIYNATNGKLCSLTGNGGIFTIDGYKRGASGVMPGIGAVAYFVKMYDAFVQGNEEKARAIFENMMPFLWFEDQSLEFFIACEKAILKRQGIIARSTVRFPGFDLNAADTNELFTLYDRLHPIEHADTTDKYA
jgi:4-hydroxy-tetrahydrodipicolinate synthase